MSEAGERRTLNVARVDLTTLVDICVQDGSLSPFQAQSANVSGRGMHVRTSFLPEIGEDLVCRFEHDGTEILVEGRVAWRAEGADSGEFGIQFTALDASSAEILRSLGQSPKAHGSNQRRSLVPRLFALDDEDEGGHDFVAPGDRVRLHIEGLAGPMKACVHDGTPRKVRVGSSLEFLKVGRSLKIEDVEGGQSRGAHVDSVNVVLNPTTSVPELVVMLRYEGMSPTPPPAMAEQAKDPKHLRAQARTAAFSEEDEGEDFDSEIDGDPLPAPLRPAAEALRARLGGAVHSASSALERTKDIMSDVAASARDRLSRFKRTSPSPRKVQQQSASPSTRRSSSVPRRTTAPPAHLRSSLAEAGVVQRERQESRGSMRPQTRSIPAAAEPSEASRKKRLGIIGAVALLALTGSALALRGFSSKDVAPAPSAAAVVPADAAKTPANPSRGPGAVAPAVPGAVIAEVPLFGPKAMATAEAARDSGPPVSDAEAEKLAAAVTVDDEAWEEEVGPPRAKPAEVAPWGRGKLHLPTIHRVRLDGAGTELAGAAEGSGFTVVVPGRKAMESGRAIEKRDKRIIQAKASNTARGASIHFEFRGPVPAYRVRLREEFVEFLISAPQDGVAQR